MATEYARLDLLEPIPTKGGGPEAHKVVIYRPTARQLTEVFDSGEKAVARLELFSNNCCRALNGTDQPLDFVFGDLNAADGAEIGSMIAALAEDARECTPDIMGDGFQEPLVYTLQRPIKMTLKEDGERVTQLVFEARRVRDIGEYLDATGAGREFSAFMKAFAKPIGPSVPIMTDILIDAIDFIDYFVIRDQVMGRFVNARRRWKRAS